MLVIGLTGSIAMGKSTAAGMFRRLGIPVYDADSAVHALLAKGGAAVAPVNHAFPGVVSEGAVDRKQLAARVFGNTMALRRLERVLHPLVTEKREAFLAIAARQKRPVVVLDIPLLFEVKADRSCDVVVVVTAPRFLQLARLRRRPGMDGVRIGAIIARQMPDAEKRKRADFVVHSGLGRGPTFAEIRRCVGKLRGRQMFRGTRLPTRYC
jgi:dephospho-CoA kinase